MPKLSDVLKKEVEKYQKEKNELETKSYLLKSFEIKKIFIKNYKMFHDFTLDLSENITIIAGINGVGKTSLLEFIYSFINYTLENKDTSYLGISYLINEVSKEETLSFNSLFLEHYVNGVKQILETSINRFIKRNLIYLPTSDKNYDEVEDLILGYIDYFVYTKGESAFIGYENLQNDINKIFKGFNLSFQFTKINSKNKKPLFKNYSDIKGDIEFRLKDLSTGEKTLLSKVLYLFLSDVKGKVILVDEPELSLHPTWQSKILKIYENFAKEYNCQIIIATHSPHIIGSAKNEYLRILRFDEENNVEVINNLTAYGRDVHWVLKEVMGTDFLREKKILDKFDSCYKLIEEEKFEEAEKEIDKLESVIGEFDSDIIKLRNELAFERMEYEEDN